MPRAVFLSLAACATALHVQRRAIIGPAVASAIVAPPARAGLIDFDPEAAKAAGRARAEQRRAEQKAFTDKLSTLGGVEGQVSTVGGASAQESREKGSGGIIKMKREPDRKGEGLPESELGLKEALSDVGPTQRPRVPLSTLRHRRVCTQASTCRPSSTSRSAISTAKRTTIVRPTASSR